MAHLTPRLLTPFVVLLVAVSLVTTTTPLTRTSLNGALRLNHPFGCVTEGYLEINIHGQWGTICNDNFDDVDATVACRQHSRGRYQRGTVVTGPQPRSTDDHMPNAIHLDQVGCNVDDTAILTCAHSPVGVHDCSHREDVYIACHNGSSRIYCPGSQTHAEQEGAIRLVDGACSAQGRLEIFHNNQWGTICDDGFDMVEATIVCKQLGYDTGVAIKAPVPGIGRIWLDDLMCTSQQESLAECQGATWGLEDCSHTEDTGVHCFNSFDVLDCFGKPVPDDGVVRLVDGNCHFEGRLEVWHEHRWGTVCDAGFSESAAMTVCKQMGHRYGWIHTSTVAVQGAKIWLKQVSCNATATSLASCSHGPWGQVYGCDHNRDVGVICSNTTSKLNCAGDEINYQDGDLRLQDGECPSHGRLEVYHSGRWGTICDDSFTDQAAVVACKQLGYQFGYTKIATAGSGITWLDNVQCSGNVSGRLADVCRHAPWGQEDCGHSEDIGIQCYNNTDCKGIPFPPEGSVQLTGTPCAYSGRLEVFHAGRWGTVCGVDFRKTDINMVCRQMGHQDGVMGSTEVTSVPALLAHKLIWLSHVTCSREHTHLTECSHSPWGAPGCEHNQDVFITCKNTSIATDCSGAKIDFVEGLPPCGGFDQPSCWLVGNTYNYIIHEIELRLFGGQNTSSGRLEIFHSGRWGTVCDDSFGRTDVTIACRQLGFHRGNLGNQLIAQEGTGQTWLDEVRCLPTDTKLGDCHHNVWGREDCSHSEDVRLLCDNTTECDSNPCQNGASCMPGFNMYKCDCKPGYYGVNCHLDFNECLLNPCVNGATCQDRINDYTCLCVPGYSGKNCSLDIDDCLNNPCENGATCEDRLRGFTCNCSPGFRGLKCEINRDECAAIPCQAGGTCKDGINDFTCRCVPGFTGKRCHINIDECKGNPCKNNGTCLDGNNWYICRCPANYYGINCQHKSDGKADPGHNVIYHTGGKAAGQQGSAPKVDSTTKGVAIAAIFLSIIALMIVMVIFVKWRLVGQSSSSATAEAPSDGREDEAAFYNNSSDKVNLVP